ncbi:MAG: hypothetical protein V4642_12770 [Bacteroidota bacterium]
MKKILSAVLLVVAVGFTGCEEEVTAPTPTPAASNYFPMTQGSSWTYDLTVGFPTDTVYTETKTITGDTTVNGKKYVRVLSTDEESTPEYFRRSNDTVFTLNENGNDEIVAIERKGASWTKTYVEEGESMTIVFNTVDKGISRTVSGKPYSDVLHVKGVGEVNIGGQTTSMEFNGYLAKGVGPIEENTPISSAKLKTYSIK